MVAVVPRVGRGRRPAALGRPGRGRRPAAAAAARRGGDAASAGGALVLGELVIDEATYTARLRGRLLELTYKEFELLKYLAQHAGPGVHPRATAAGGLGLRLLRRHPHGRRARPAAARQARRRARADDRHRAQRRLQVRPPEPRGAGCARPPRGRRRRRRRATRGRRRNGRAVHAPPRPARAPRSSASSARRGYGRACRRPPRADLDRRPAPSPVDAAEVEALAAAAAAADGTAPLSEQVLRHLRHPGAAHLLARRRARRARRLRPARRHRRPRPTAPPTPSPSWSCTPHRRRAGVGAALPPRCSTGQPGAAGLGARRLPAAAALAARLGFTADRELWRMRRSLREPFAEPELPDGVTLRPFGPGGDEASCCASTTPAFAWHPEQGGWTLDDLARARGRAVVRPGGLLPGRRRGRPRARRSASTGRRCTRTGSDGRTPIGEVYVLGGRPRRAAAPARAGADPGRPAAPARPRPGRRDALRRGRQRRRRAAFTGTWASPLGRDVSYRR